VVIVSWRRVHCTTVGRNMQCEHGRVAASSVTTPRVENFGEMAVDRSGDAVTD
jgi:hypothetical protein